MPKHLDDKYGEAVRAAHDALQAFDDEVDMTDEDSVSSWWAHKAAPALDALDAVRCTPVHGSCNLPAGHAGQHNAFAPSHALENATCAGCKGSGTMKGMTQGHGPDDYEIDIECSECGGVGVVAIPSTTLQKPEAGILELAKDMANKQQINGWYEKVGQILGREVVRLSALSATRQSENEAVIRADAALAVEEFLRDTHAPQWTKRLQNVVEAVLDRAFVNLQQAITDYEKSLHYPEPMNADDARSWQARRYEGLKALLLNRADGTAKP